MDNDLATELKTVWVLKNDQATTSEPDISGVAAMLDEGWELVSWYPVAATPRPPTTRAGAVVAAAFYLYDVLLLRKVESTVPGGGREIMRPIVGDPHTSA